MKSNKQANNNKKQVEKLEERTLGEGPRDHQPVGPHWDPTGDLACFQFFSPVACFKIRNVLGLFQRMDFGVHHYTIHCS